MQHSGMKTLSNTFFGLTGKDSTLHINRILPLAIPFLIVGFFSYMARNYQLDDALIYLRYIKNFQTGFGLAYNPGEKFNGLTSPFFTYVILIGSLIFANLQILTIVLSAFFLLGAAFLGGKLFAKEKLETIFTASVVGSFGYFYSTFGMETPLFLMLIGLSLYLYKVESDYFLIALALLVITRSEGIFLAIPITVAYLFKNRRIPDLRLLLLAVIIFIIPFVFNYFYYGDFLPATGNAKIGQGKSGLWGEKWIFLHVRYLLDGFFSGSHFAFIVFSSFAFYGVFSLLREKVLSCVVAIIFTLLLLGFYVGLNIPNYHWYYAPFFYFMLIFACHGFWRCSVTLLDHGFSNIRNLFVFLLILAGSLLAWSKVISLDERGRHEDYAAIGNWLKNNTPINATIAMVEIGTVGWYADRNIIDILGLVSPHNADYIGKREFSGWLKHYQPDYILRHDPIWPHEQSAGLLEQDGYYLPMQTFNHTGYILLKKSHRYSDIEIKNFPGKQAPNQANLDEMVRTSLVGAPAVLKDGALLFAHAPSSVSLAVRYITNSIKVSYGIKDAAMGKHYGVCFEIIQDSDKKKLMQSCINAAAQKDELARSETINVLVQPGEKLIFKTLCFSSCDHAWSYWSEVDLK